MICECCGHWFAGVDSKKCKDCIDSHVIIKYDWVLSQLNEAVSCFTKDNHIMALRRAIELLKQDR